MQPATGSKGITALLAVGRFIPERRFSLTYSIRVTSKVSGFCFENDLAETKHSGTSQATRTGSAPATPGKRGQG